ncbi:predicted protein [Chaetoceros tenuissimus]|uniref:Uncharacterized protein n=1 Tax=Chaetoceros tenuissimus TaxID=426638 RepID=A0AAD3HDK5_9STRA|nr:predicted protein [Chaetoceros tenuissimus]
MIVTEPRAGLISDLTMEKEPLVSSEKLNRLSDPSGEEKHAQHSEDQRQDSAKELNDAIVMNGNHPTDEREEEHKVRFGELPKDGKHVSNRRGSILLSKKKGTNSSPRQSVFDRLCNTQTVASIHRRLVSKEIVKRKKRSSSAPPLRSRTTTSNHQASKPKNVNTSAKKATSGQLQKQFKLSRDESFARLAGRQTKAAKIRQKGKQEVKESTRRNTHHRNQVRRVRSTSISRPPVKTSLARWKSEPAVPETFDFDATYDDEVNDVGTNVESVGTVPLEIDFASRNEIFTTNTHKPEDGYHPLDSTKYGLDGCLAAYEAGGMSPKEATSEIIHALFENDLSDEAEWTIKEPLHRELGLPLGEKGYSFFIEATGTYKEGEEDDKEKLSASATGNVVFIFDLYEIHVENYSFTYESGSI